ncbi:DNA-processing protein DprA [Bdellovibrionota bacterium FG-1]
MLLDYPVFQLSTLPTPEYSPELSQVEGPALTQLHIQGKPDALALLKQLPHRGLAVVGTRCPQPRCVDLVRSTLGQLRGRNLIILSGLARGIDSVAHESALRAELPTIAILGGPLDQIYPRQNQDLAQAILETGGLLVTEYPNGTEIKKYFFLQRNRLISGWSKATWIVQAGARSGALNTASWTLGRGGDCYVTPCFPGDPTLAGNQKLLENHVPIPLWKVEDLGHSWSELISTPSSVAAPAIHPSGTEDEEILTQYVKKNSTERGGIQVEELLNWALHKNWAPDRFFQTLATSLNERRIEDQNGILNAPQTFIP